MQYTVVGLFDSQDKAKKVSTSLENTGIRNEDYIIYKTDRKLPAQSSWKKILGLEKPHQTTDNDKLITSVAVRSAEELENVKNSFAENKAVKIYEFKDMTIDEAKDLDYIKKIVALRAKSHIYAMPSISVSSSQLNKGINAEIRA